jgi:arsenate reductase-like glutaredoxin family protein
MLAAMRANPMLINRPLVFGPKGSVPADFTRADGKQVDEA